MASKGNYRILLVDRDAGDYCKKLSALLGGCKIIVRTDNSGACDFIFHNDIDLVLLDHRSDARTTETLRFLKSIKPATPVIVMTGCGSEELAVTVFRCGADDYLKKPFDMVELKAAVNGALGIRETIERKGPDQEANGLHRAVRYIHKHLSTRIRVSQVAREAGMSVSCFERSFKKKMGTTFTGYVNGLRIQKAKELLEKNNLSMSHIAFACGFTNQFHFTRTFKKITNVSPSAFKKSLRTPSSRRAGTSRRAAFRSMTPAPVKRP